MPKPSLVKEDEILEGQIIETLVAGLHEWRPDLNYPLSHSDMQACVRGLMKMYEIKRLPLPIRLKLACRSCEGLGHFVQVKDNVKYLDDCKTCDGTGWIPSH